MLTPTRHREIEANGTILRTDPPLIREKKRSLRILQIYSVLSVGGAETWLLALLKYFREHEDDVDVHVAFDILLTGGEPAAFDEEARTLGARLFYVPFRRRNIIAFIRDFRSILKRGNYDAVHDHQDYFAGIHFLMGLGRLPSLCIAHVHNPLYQRKYYENGPGRLTAQSIGKRLLSKLATHVMGTSQQVLEEYEFVGESFRRTITGAAHCGFDVSRFQGDRRMAQRELCRELAWDYGAKIIIFVGRLESDEVEYAGRMMTHKNPAFALEIARECVSRNPSVRFAIAGGGDSKKREFEALVRSWNLEKQIRFLGIRSDVPRLMLASDLLLFPSLAEGLGMVVVEAQAAGLRVLASDTTPRECVVISELVDFLPLTDVKPWADRALHLIGLDPPDGILCNARVRDSAFSIENSAARLVRIYGSHFSNE